jgi:hypothetical protein
MSATAGLPLGRFLAWQRIRKNPVRYSCSTGRTKDHQHRRQLDRSSDTGLKSDQKICGQVNDKREKTVKLAIAVCITALCAAPLTAHMNRAIYFEHTGDQDVIFELPVKEFTGFRAK